MRGKHLGLLGSVFDVEGLGLLGSVSVDQKNNYVFEVMPTSVKESASKDLGYWSTANGDDTMVTLWNPAEEAQDLLFTVHFSGGHYNLPVHLGPRATRMLNLSEIVQNQIPDPKGNLIPAAIHEGSATLSGAQAENEHILVAVDAGIAACDAKREYDSVRPVTAIPLLFRGKTIRSWGGPGKGTVEMDGSQWIPYQAATFPTPPFPEYVSGHSTYSAAAARILGLWTGSDRFGDTVTIPAGSSTIEPGVTPAHPVTLRWETFTDAAHEAGTSRRYGGIHFRSADLAGRLLGRVVAFEAWTKAQSYFDGSIARDTPADTRAASDIQLSR